MSHFCSRSPHQNNTMAKTFDWKLTEWNDDARPSSEWKFYSFSYQEGPISRRCKRSRFAVTQARFITAIDGILRNHFKRNGSNNLLPKRGRIGKRAFTARRRRRCERRQKGAEDGSQHTHKETIPPSRLYTTSFISNLRLTVLSRKDDFV